MLAAQGEQIRNHPPELEHDERCAQVRRAGEAFLAYEPDDAERSLKRGRRGAGSPTTSSISGIDDLERGASRSTPGLP
jgi:hypothetical protein